MARRILFGPVESAFAERYLGPLRALGRCRTFGPEAGPGIDQVLDQAAAWQQVQAGFHEGWQADAVVLWLAYRGLPRWLTEVPVPVLGLAADWNWLWDHYRAILPFCDRLFLDPQGVDAFRSVGVAQVQSARLFGGSDTWLPMTPVDSPRDIDLLFVGNLQPAVQRGRLPVVAALARLADRYRVVIRSQVPFEEYRQLCQRARVVVNPTVRGEWNQRVCESVFSGALLAVESSNREVLQTLRPELESLTWDADTLVARLAAVLADEPRRVSLARAAQERLGEVTFSGDLTRLLESLEPEWEALTQQRAVRGEVTSQRWLSARLAARFTSASPDPVLEEEVLRQFQMDQADAETLNRVGLLLAISSRPGALAASVRLYEQGLQRWPGHPVLGYNAVRVLQQCKREADTVTLARDLLNRWQECPADPALWEGLIGPPGFDEVRVEWARIGWQLATDPQARSQARRSLLNWHLHLLLGDAGTGGAVPYFEAVLARGDLPRGRAGLGCALARQGHLQQALPHLQQAVQANPFDRRAAQALAQVLADTGRCPQRQDLERQRRLLHRAAPELVPLEHWFAGPVPEPQALVSLIILCWNQLEYTRPCLESVLRFTRPPFELILVDNGSSDETPAYLEELQQRPEPARVVVLRNEQNRGFAAGCNQGIAAARGEYLVFLNNDTIVTPGWLEGLVALSRFDWPRVGMTGAVSNAATPEQTVPTRYTNVEQMLDFARELGRNHAGQARELDRLSGFCLLARREVLAAIGGFDERYGLGFFEDDDLCLRARRAGYRLLVARDVFIHHYGSRTVQALGLNPEEQLSSNHARFVEKWGEQTPQGYRNARFTTRGQQLASPSGDAVFSQWNQPQVADHDRLFSGNTLDVSAVQVAPARVSLCMIVKNEEANLRACIEPVRHLFHEVVVNDTGSMDGTVALARSLGARVVEHPWQDSFCLARNQSIEAATGEWIFWLDADDRVDAENVRKLQQLFAHLPSAPCGYALTCRCLSSEGGETDVIHVRLFPRHPQVRWQHRVHEQILPTLRSLGGDVVFTDVVVTHVGYTDPALRGRKLDRDLRLLQLERAELGDHPFTLFNLGCIHLERSHFAQALPLLELSLAGSHVRDSIVRKLYAQIARCRWELGSRIEAKAGCREGLVHYPQDEELLFLLAQYHQESGEWEPARAHYHRLIEGPRKGNHFGSTATGLRGFRGMNNLGLVYQRLGNPARAEAWFQRTVQDHPGYVNGWLALGELLASQRRWREAEVAFARAAQLVPEDGRIQARLEEVRQQR